MVAIPNFIYVNKVLLFEFERMVGSEHEYYMRPVKRRWMVGEDGNNMLVVVEMAK